MNTKKNLIFEMLLLVASLLVVTTSCEKEDENKNPDDENKEVVYGEMTDTRDATTYKTVTIGDQIWMAENLKYLSAVESPSVGSDTEAYYYVYDYDGNDIEAAKTTDNFDIYGVLYNWTAAMSGAASSNANPSAVKGVCPDGWHLPSDAEWAQLADYLGGENLAGAKLNAQDSNEAGFSGLYAGYCTGEIETGKFEGKNSSGVWLSSTENGDNNAFRRSITSSNSSIAKGYGRKMFAASVRCIKN
jgi:uncharacterized protein (TIGR02145 family)